eukprot:11428650-Alexandrium_andersonii.AAC.1
MRNWGPPLLREVAQAPKLLLRTSCVPLASGTSAVRARLPALASTLATRSGDARCRKPAGIA